MPRNMSFFLTTDQIRHRTKSVTRRLGWRNLKPGEQVQAVVKCQGLKKGEHVERLALLEITDVRAERLDDIDQMDVMLEGFPRLRPHEFVKMFCRHNRVPPDVQVNRIAFRYVR